MPGWLNAGLYSLFVYTKLSYTKLATLLYVKFYLGMGNSSDTVLTKKELLLVSKSFAISIRPAAIFLIM